MKQSNVRQETSNPSQTLKLLTAQAQAADKLAGAAEKKLRLAKSKFKTARKAFKQAKKAAKKLAKEAKRTRKKLAARQPVKKQIRKHSKYSASQKKRPVVASVVAPAETSPPAAPLVTSSPSEALPTSAEETGS